MAEKVRLYFATDVHGSEQCFRKFLNAGAAYGPDAMVLGGDVAGKAVQAIVRQPDGRYRFTFRGREHDLEEGEELDRVERLIADNGYYPWRSAPGELEARVADGTVDGLLLDLMRERLETWMLLADERLRPRGLYAHVALGPSRAVWPTDPIQIAVELRSAPGGGTAALVSLPTTITAPVPPRPEVLEGPVLRAGLPHDYPPVLLQNRGLDLTVVPLDQIGQVALTADD